MKITLKEFQEDAVIKLVRHMRSAARDSRTGDLQAVSLSSVTGSGKTVVLTRAIELMLQGDEEHAPVPGATFLWVTDQPELNEQTRKKMQATSTVLTGEKLVVIDASFDEETLHPGAVHFLNIQKVGKDKSLVTRGDKHTYNIWEIIKNTVDAMPGAFFVIIDEAHRGMIEDEKRQNEAATIIQKFIKGAPGELPPVPVVVGISATPDRFNQLIAGTGRSHRPVDVDVAEVRASGLIKDTIVLHHPKKEQPTDMTMLREAARALKAFSAHWSTYCGSQDESVSVVPILVVQVEDAGGKGKISETDIALAIRMLRDEVGTLSSDAFAHAFQEGTALSFGGDQVRYLAPSEIQSDPDVRVVFFKTSLNTGWDCPRAEVMMSFRAASDATSIAQLVGRMVRAPLARRIVGSEVLNTVPLYLPHYDAKGLAKVIAKLSKPDDGMAPVEVQDGDEIVSLHRAPGADAAFQALAALPSYVVPRKRKANQVRRLMKLARHLANDEIDEDGTSKAYALLLKVLNDEYESVKNSRRFKEIVEERAKIEIDAVNWDVGMEGTREGQSIKVDIAAENVEDLFEATGRKLNEGLHKWWWRERVKGSAGDRERAKLELFALCAVATDATRKVEKVAQETVQKWLKQHSSAIAKLKDASRAAYDEIKSLAASPELTSLAYPISVFGKQSEESWPKHLYVDDDGDYPTSPVLNQPERKALESELMDDAVVGWLRNIPRKPWALCVPYRWEGEDRPMYPDFLVVRKEAGRLVVDILEPHTISLADAPAKAAGLARFAAQHADMFGRIKLIMIDDKQSKSLDLTDETVRDRVKAITLPAELRALFDKG